MHTTSGTCIMGAQEEALALNVIQMEDKDKLIIRKGQTKR